MDELKHLLELIHLEKEEDLKQYEKEILNTPLHIRKQKGTCWHPVEVAGAQIEAGEQYHISLKRLTHMDTPHVFQTGGSVTFFAGGDDDRKDKQLRGVVVAVDKSEMKIAVGADELPDWLYEEEVGVDMLFDDVTYREMRHAIEQLMQLEEGRTQVLRDILLGVRKASFTPVTIVSKPELLNDKQIVALENILSAEDIAVVHGPPGTGKTTTLVQSVKITLEQEKQVLVTAPSNTAVDLLTEKLAEKGVKVLRLGNPARVNSVALDYTLEEQLKGHMDYKFLKKLRKQADEMRREALKHKRNFGREEREQRKQLLREAKDILKDAQRVEYYMIESLIEQAQVITATLVGSVSKYIRKRRFSTVFIDEVAQALEPATWIPILKADRVVFAGDHCQLPPTVKSFLAEKKGLGISLFEKVVKRHPGAVVMLEEQYRMNQQIMEFSNQEFYKGELKAHATVASQVLNKEGSKLLSTAVTFVDTVGGGYDDKRHPDSLSFYNEEEATLLVQTLEQMLTELPEGETKPSIGLISPYRAQVSLLKELVLGSKVLEEWREYIQVHSVDGFQGQEKDIIAISMVRSNAEGKLGFLNDTRRMNVAMTRARKKLLMIGDSATLSSHSFYQDLMEYVQEIEAYQSIWE
ncbi:AAA domain-containing protein [Algivirga pacifica]|uniref:AAA domain-containing protein n=1 Tax=Algivirga pacifica TaxID=1162670 RepID=A0ABP9D4Y6_9BACT